MGKQGKGQMEDPHRNKTRRKRLKMKKKIRTGICMLMAALLMIQGGISPMTQAVRAQAEGSTQNTGAVSAYQERDGIRTVVSEPVLKVGFDKEDAQDESGNGNHGQVIGNPDFAEGVKGKAICFQNPEDRQDQATQYVNFGQPEELQFGEGSFTIMFWYKADPSETKESSVISNKDWSTGDNSGFNIGDMRQGINLNFNTVGSGKGRSETDRFSGATDNSWHHVAAVIDRDSQKQISLFIDGRQAFGGSGSYGSKTNTSDVSSYQGTVDVLDFVLGASGNKKYGLNNAYVDELLVYKEALSMEDVSEMIQEDQALLSIRKMQEYVGNLEPGCRFTEEAIQAIQTRISEAVRELSEGTCEDPKALAAELSEEFNTFLEGAKENMSFHLISDVHVRNEDGTEALNFIKGLQDMKEINPDASALVSAGDNTEFGGADEQSAFFKILKEYNPLTDGKTMIALGNHDVRGPQQYWETDPAGINGYWPTAYELYMSNNKEYMPDTEGKTYFDYWIDGYHFIVLNPENAPKDTAYLTEEQLIWLEEKLRENEDPARPAFVIIHQALNDTHWRSNNYNGFGKQDAAVKEILERHPQTIFFSGHIHNGLGAAEVIDREFGTLVDVPAFKGSQYGMTDRGTGYEVYVYDDEILFRARNFVTSAWLPEYDVSVRLKSLPVLAEEADNLEAENYTEESWQQAFDAMQTPLAEAKILMNRKYEDENLPTEWLYHEDTRARMEELRKELKNSFALLEERDLIRASEVRLNKISLTMTEQDSVSLSARILPENTTDSSLTWTSSAEDVVSVDAEGKVEAKSCGSAVITVSTANGKTDRCEVTVLEAPVTVNTRIPVHYLGEAFELPDQISVTRLGKTYDTAVSWNETDMEAVRNASDTGKYTVKGILEEPEDFVIELEVTAAPKNVVYFVDSGASSFTEKGKLMLEANSTVVKNTVPDQSYEKERGWGYTNSIDDVDVNGSGGAFETIRHFRGDVNGKTLTYQFALEEGIYEITAGYKDPWAKYAGDKRHGRVSVADSAGTLLAVKEDHHISGEETRVQFDQVRLEKAGDILVNTEPLNTGSSNCDMMISFLVIRKVGEIAETPEDPDTSGLQTAILLAESLSGDGYTQDSYGNLVLAVQAAKSLLEREGLTQEEVDAEIGKLSDAVKNLLPVDNSSLAQQLEQKKQELALARKEVKRISGELETEKATAESLAKELETAQGQVSSLTEQLKTVNEELEQYKEELENKGDLLDSLKEKAEEVQTLLDAEIKRTDELQKQMAETNIRVKELKKSLTGAKERALTLKEENTRLEKAKAELDAEIQKEKERAEAEKAKVLEELKKAREESERIREELEKVRDAVNLKEGDRVTVKGVLYCVTDAKRKLAEAVGIQKKNIRTVKVADTVKIKGITCAVTSVADRAFANLKKLRQVRIGKNVTKIGSLAFSGDRNLSRIRVETKKLKNVGSKALKGISARAVIRVPREKKKIYTKYFRKKGQKKTVKIK